MQALTFQTARSLAELAHKKGEEAQHDFLLGRDTRRLGVFQASMVRLPRMSSTATSKAEFDLIRGKGENLLIDSGNWTLPEYNNGMGDFLVQLLDREKNALKYIFVTHFHYDHVGNALMLKKRYGATVVCHPLDRPIIEDPMLVTRRENITRFGTTPEAILEDFNLRPGESFGLSDPAIVNKYWNVLSKSITL